MLDERTFAPRAAATLKKLEACLTDLDPRLEADRAADVLKLEFDDGRIYVINSHSAARQIWVAAESRAWHLSWDDARQSWVDTREGRELWALVTELLTKKLGRPVSL